MRQRNSNSSDAAGFAFVFLCIMIYLGFNDATNFTSYCFLGLAVSGIAMAIANRAKQDEKIRQEELYRRQTEALEAIARNGTRSLDSEKLDEYYPKNKRAANTGKNMRQGLLLVALVGTVAYILSAASNMPAPPPAAAVTVAPPESALVTTSESTLPATAEVAALPPSLPTNTPPGVAPVLDAPTEAPTAAATLAVAPTAVPVMVQALKPLTVFSAPINAPAHRIGQIKQGGKIILSGLSPDANWYYFSYYDRPAWITSDSASVTVLSGEVGSLSVIIPDPTATPLPIVPTPDPVPPTTVLIIVPRPTRNSPAVGACSPCPHSCDAAVAMGCTAVQAAACGLDRDKDGVACYGD